MCKNKIVVMFLTIVGLVGCSTPTRTSTFNFIETSSTRVTSTSPVLKATPVPSFTAVHSPTVTFSPSPEASPTSTVTHTPRPPTHTTTPTWTNTPDVGLSVQCLKIASEPPSGGQSIGRLFLVEGDNKPSYLLNMNTGEKTLLPQKQNASVASAAVSPDGKWLAYQEIYETASTISFSLVLLSADEQTHMVLPWDKNWRWIVDWLDASQMLITKARGEFDLDTLIVLNPFTNEQKELIPDYPGIRKWFRTNDWLSYSLSETVYDPTLTRVVFPQLDEIVLRDIEAGKTLAIFPVLLNYFPVPKWSPNGHLLMVVGSKSNEIPSGKLWAYDQALFGISRDGQIKLFADLAAIYTNTKIGQLSWSPDGRYVAFWLSVEPISYPDLYSDLKGAEYARLAILDTTTKEVTNYCVPGDFSSTPVWSPDSHQIAAQYLYGDNSSHVYVVDIIEGFAVEVTEDLMPIGWLASP